MASPFDAEAIDAIAYALAFGFPELSGKALIDAVGVDAVNYLSAWQYAIGKDTPAKLWWNLRFDHPAISKAMRLPRTEPLACYALTPFRFWRDPEGKPLILAAHPAPAIMDADWLGIETVLAWDPNTDTATILGDDRPQLVGECTDDASQIYASPRAFFLAWMRRRAQFAVQMQIAAKSHWTAMPAETDPLPGALIIGEPEAIRWPTHEMPRHFTAVGIEPKRLNRAILKSAALPMCIGTDMARAA